MAGVRTPDLEHQKRTLYPLRYAPHGLDTFLISSLFYLERRSFPWPLVRKIKKGQENSTSRWELSISTQLTQAKFLISIHTGAKKLHKLLLPLVFWFPCFLFCVEHSPAKFPPGKAGFCTKALCSCEWSSLFGMLHQLHLLSELASGFHGSKCREEQ